MTQKTINTYLTIAIAMLAVIPLLASYWLLDEVLKGAISLAVKPEQKYLLESYQEDLKELRELNPEKEPIYKSRFQQASNELLIHQQPEIVQQVLRDTWLTYYLILFLSILIFTLLASVWLSRKVAKAYKILSHKDIANAQKIQELSYFDQWQTMTRKLAHEINNPLTPIEMMVSNLSRTYNRTDPETFQQILQDTQSVVSEEVHKLKHMVRHFSRFSKLPSPELLPTDLTDYCTNFVRQHQHSWERLNLSFHGNSVKNSSQVLLDPLLFSQCLHNLINNAQQANPDLPELEVQLQLQPSDVNEVLLRVFNKGKAIDEEEAELIFQMYHTSNNHQDNVGLGLPIVKKIILDHRGGICCVPLHNGAAFDITLPVVTTKAEHGLVAAGTEPSKV